MACGASRLLSGIGQIGYRSLALTFQAHAGLPVRSHPDQVRHWWLRAATFWLQVICSGAQRTMAYPAIVPGMESLAFVLIGLPLGWRWVWGNEDFSECLQGAARPRVAQRKFVTDDSKAWNNSTHRVLARLTPLSAPDPKPRLESEAVRSLSRLAPGELCPVSMRPASAWVRRGPASCASGPSAS